MTQSFARRQRAQHHRLEQRINELITREGDACELCGTAFEDAAATFYGVRFGRLFITGRCCVGKLEPLVTAGIYIKKQEVQSL